MNEDSGRYIGYVFINWYGILMKEDSERYIRCVH